MNLPNDQEEAASTTETRTGEGTKCACEARRQTKAETTAAAGVGYMCVGSSSWKSEKACAFLTGNQGDRWSCGNHQDPALIVPDHTCTSKREREREARVKSCARKAVAGRV